MSWIISCWLDEIWSDCWELSRTDPPMSISVTSCWDTTSNMSSDLSPLDPDVTVGVCGKSYSFTSSDVVSDSRQEGW